MTTKESVWQEQQNFNEKLIINDTHTISISKNEAHLLCLKCDKSEHHFLKRGNTKKY